MTDLRITEAAKRAAMDVLLGERLYFRTRLGDVAVNEDGAHDIAEDVLSAVLHHLIAGLAEDEAAVERVARALWKSSGEDAPMALEPEHRYWRAFAIDALRALGADDD